MKKKTMVGLAVAAGVTLLTAGVALAESPTLRGHLFGKDASSLTETQKTDVQTYQDKLAQLKKDFYATMGKGWNPYTGGSGCGDCEDRIGSCFGYTA